ncbi:MAG: efflux RND transporter periplasmic adaptor subunit [Patescibacteria group bacterium]
MKPHSKIKSFIKNHKFISTIILIIIIIAGYYSYKAIFTKEALPQYIMAPVQIGKIIQSVTGSGQVSAENQIEVTSEVSAKITSIKVAVGNEVKAGDLLATLDAKDASISLENAKIAYEKLVEPAKKGDVVNAENNLTKAYSDGFGAISNAFLDIPGIMSGLKDTLYSRDGYLSDQSSQNLTNTGREYRNTAGLSYDQASIRYASILEEYKTISKNSPRPVIESMLEKTYEFTRQVAETIIDTQNAVTFISVSQPDYKTSTATTASANINTWLGQANSNLSSLLSAKNTIESSADTLKNLKEGADALDIRSEKLALEQAQRTYDKYFIRAPFAGVIGKIPVKIYDQASSGTSIATIVSNRKITTIPLNEVDAVKVKKGNKVELTFDAVQNLTVDGVVTEVDLVGTQSQGVVTYNIKIAFEGIDQRILPGMSVDANVITQEKTGILVVPTGAIKGKGNNTYVETMIESVTSPLQIPVTTGESDDTNTEITDGIEEGQKIIVRTVAAGTGPASSGTPTIFSSFGNSQRGVIQNANRVNR